MNKLVTMSGAHKILSDLDLHRFIQSEGIRGPHKIPIKRQKRNQFHRIFSPKAGNRVVLAESQLEADAIILQEARGDIVSLCEQPMRINGRLNKRPYYTFDLGITRDGLGEEFIEIKPESVLDINEDGESQPPYWSAISQWCQTRGFICSVLTDKDISENKTLIRNWRLLLGFVKRGIETSNNDLVLELLDTIKHYPQISIHQLVDHTVNRTDQEITCAVSVLLHQHAIDARLDSVVFTRHSELSLSL